MADYSFTAGNVKLVSGAATTGTAAVAVAQGDLVYYVAADDNWALGTDDMPRSQAGIATSAASAGQTFAIANQPDSEIDLGDFILNEGAIVVASAANAGKLAPYADLNIPGGDTLFVVGRANARRRLALSLDHTGITAMATINGVADITLDDVTLVATGTVS